MRFQLEKEFRFEASHQLWTHDGPCVRLHGHSWRGRVVVEGTRLHEEGPKKNMLLDFGDLSRILRRVTDRLDHHHLNEVLGTDAPTSEIVAVWVAGQIIKDFETMGVGDRVRVRAVRIEETCTSAAEYYP